jgi:precorrin-3B C17-methyltransferase
MHDFAILSLSDCLTDWERIKKRLHCAGDGDFVIALYNPKSSQRVTYIEEARGILLNYKRSETPVGIVRNAKRGKEEVFITNLDEMLKHPIDMLTIVIIGNQSTYVKNGKMITPRGYVL